MVVGPAGADPLLLGADLAFEFLVDRDGGLAAHLVVEVAQVGGALPVVEQAVEGQRAGVGGAQPAPDQDDGDQPALGGGPAVEVGRCFDLGHDVLGHVAGESGRASGRSPGKNTAVVGRLSSQPCWRIAWKKIPAR